MRRWLLIFIAALAVRPAVAADSDVPSMTAATSLTSSVTYLAQGGALNRKLAFNTSMFDIASNALIVKDAGLGYAKLQNGSGNNLLRANTGAAPSELTTATGILTWLTTPSSANLAAAVTDETGSGSLVFGTNPSIAGGAFSGTFSGTPTFSGNLTFSGVPKLTGLSAGTQVSCLGLDSGNSIVLNAAACGSGGAGSISVSGGGNTTTGVTTLAFGNGFVATPNGASATSTVNLAVTDPAAKSGNYSVAAGDMGNALNLGGSGSTLTLPAASSTIFAPGMTTSIVVTASGNWTLTNSTGLTLSGITGTTLGPGTNGTFVANADGTHLDFFGTQMPLVASMGGTGVETLTGLAKGNGTSAFTAAVAGTDYAAAPTGSANTPLLNNGSGGFTNGTSTGNTTNFVTSSGSLTAGNCAQWDASRNLIDSGSPCGSGTGGGGMFGYSDNSLTLTAATRYVPIYGSGTPSTTEADYEVKSPSATTAANLQVSISADPGVGQTLAVTLRKAGADTALTCTITGGAALTCQDLTHSVNIAQNDLIDWKVVTTGTFVATPNLTIVANNGTSNVGVTSIATGTGLTGGTITTTGTVSCVDSTSSVKGCVQVDGTTITASGGVISAVGGGGSGVLTLVSTQTASNSSTLAWTGLTGNKYQLKCNAILAASGTANYFYFQFGEGGTPTYKTSGYSWSYGYRQLDAFAGNYNQSQFSNDVGGGIASSFQKSATVNVEFEGLATATEHAYMSQNNIYNGTNYYHIDSSGVYTSDTTAITAIRVGLASTQGGTFGGVNMTSGTCSLYAYSE